MSGTFGSAGGGTLADGAADAALAGAAGVLPPNTVCGRVARCAAAGVAGMYSGPR